MGPAPQRLVSPKDTSEKVGCLIEQGADSWRATTCRATEDPEQASPAAAELMVAGVFQHITGQLEAEIASTQKCCGAVLMLLVLGRTRADAAVPRDHKGVADAGLCAWRRRTIYLSLEVAPWSLGNGSRLSLASL